METGSPVKLLIILLKSILKKLKYTKKALGKAMSPNKLRAGFCSILYDETHDIEFVRKVVGHAKIETTQRYIATKGSEKKNAAAIMDKLLEDDDHV